jgi:RNA polymerase-binding transcription factor DksA
MKEHLSRFRPILEEEKKRLLEELQRISRKSAEDPGGWSPKESGMDTDRASDDEVADMFEDLGERVALETELEKRLIDVETAINKFDNGTYGICEVSGDPIEIERLEANPAARTCKAHMG